jgi:hypothetical protein
MLETLLADCVGCIGISSKLVSLSSSVRLMSQRMYVSTRSAQLAAAAVAAMIPTGAATYADSACDGGYELLLSQLGASGLSVGQSPVSCLLLVAIYMCSIVICAHAVLCAMHCFQLGRSVGQCALAVLELA